MTVFEKMLDPSVRQAFLFHRQEKQLVSEEAVQALSEYILSCECTEDILRLKAGDFFFDAPRQFLIRKNHSERRRKVYSFKGHEKMLLRFMAFVLMDYDHIHASSLCSFRKENRTKMFFDRVRKLDRGRKNYVLKTDIHEYGGSVDQDLLMEKLEKLFSDDPEFLRFLRQLLTRNEYYRKGRLVKERVSVIDGVPIGAFLTNLYLGELDRVLETESVVYMRYTDDIAFFAETEEKARWAFEEIKRITGSLKLSINEDKTEIIPPGQEFEVLGIQVLPDGFDIGENALEKLTDKLKRCRNKQLRRYRWGKCTLEQGMHRMISFEDRLFFGKLRNDHELNWVVHAFPIITRTDSLKKLDRWVQDCIRVSGSGKLGNARYRIRYKTMKEAGYRSLLHAYYHGYSMEEEK